METLEKKVSQSTPLRREKTHRDTGLNRLNSGSINGFVINGVVKKGAGVMALLMASALSLTSRTAQADETQGPPILSTSRLSDVVSDVTGEKPKSPEPSPRNQSFASATSRAASVIPCPATPNEEAGGSASWRQYRWGLHVHFDYINSPLRFFAKRAGEIYGDQVRKYVPRVGDVTLGRNFWMFGLGFSYRLSERTTMQHRLMYSITPGERTYQFEGEGKATYAGKEFNIGPVELTHEESGNILGWQSDFRWTLASTHNDGVRFVSGLGVGAWYLTPGESKLAAAPKQFPEYRVVATTAYTGFALEGHPLLGLEWRMTKGLQLNVNGALSIGYVSIWVDPPKNELVKFDTKRYDAPVLAPRADLSLSYHF
ncbi:hypothetical protein HY772_00610 [Candidatus Woesearchaeota archaeon]|nr:hypothetical protein [Candidatus Woesearchaeota archaeon]